MAVIENSVAIRRSRSEVFDYLSDPRNELHWNPKVQLMEKLTDGPIGVGTKFRAKWSKSKSSQWNAQSTTGRRAGATSTTDRSRSSCRPHSPTTPTGRCWPRGLRRIPGACSGSCFHLHRHDASRRGPKHALVEEGAGVAGGRQAAVRPWAGADESHLRSTARQIDGGGRRPDGLRSRRQVQSAR